MAAVLPDRVFYPAAQVEPTGPFRVGADKNATKVGNGSGSVDVDVAVFDTGVYKHSDLNVVGGKDCTGGNNPYNDVYGHGTAVVGIIGARDNSFGTVGMAPGARIWALKVAGEDGLAYASNVMCAQDWMASHTFIKIINFSFAGPDGGYVETCTSGLTRQGFCQLRALGITTFVAAGNDSANANNYAPAQWPEVITVSAYADYDGKPGALGGFGDDEMAYFSNYGSVIDLSAPGVQVYTTAVGGGYEYFDGTSGASPAAAGAGALLVAQQGITGQTAILNRLLISSEPGIIPADRDVYHEPLINVSQLGAGKMTNKSSTYIGDYVRASVSEFMAGSRVTFRYDGTYVGGANAGNDGKASLEFRVPASKKGTHTITASNGRKTVTKSITVKPKLWASPSTTTVGANIKATMKGYGPGEVIKVTFDGRTMGSVTASASGTAVLNIIVPATRGGNKSVRGAGSQGSAYSATAVITPTLTLLNAPVGGSTPAKLSLRGFARYENVTFHLDSAGGTVLGNATTSATGSASAN
ncbi:MAG TPA: S8 family serine peptidase, partial [Thermomicrobiales bacterium]|nr:S8 family serine peptidase [Thermomicrobiales bacterium]